MIRTARFILVFAVLAALGYAFSPRPHRNSGIVAPMPNTPVVPAASKSVKLPEVPLVRFGDVSYAYAVIRPESASHVGLIPNFSGATSAASLRESHGCRSVINGGFYTTDDTPLGMFVTGDSTLKTAQDNPFINGYLSITGNTAALALEPPQNGTGVVLQNGPVLMIDGALRPLAIREDEHARRSVAAVTGDGLPVFLTVYDPESAYMGPLLADLPEIVRLIDTRERLHLSGAMNLDGGSASAFISDSLSLGELTHVGSIFCIR